MKLVIGTANFGTSYGISNPFKNISVREVRKILKFAKKNNISQLDTAANYKNSEKIIGQLNESKNFNIITKLPKIGKKTHLIHKFINNSLIKLKRKKLDGVLIHSLSDLNTKNLNRLILELKKSKKKGIIKKYGVSVYSKKNLEEIINNNKIDIVQFPLSIFDLRFLDNRLIQKLKRKKIKIYVRSVFLQGIIFLDSNELKKKFKYHSKKIISFKKDFDNKSEKMVNYCLGFIRNFKFVDGIIVGVNKVNNLQEIINNYKKIKINNKNKYKINSEKILIPYNWKKIK